MPAIISDQFRILNARNFVAGISGGTDNYYTFLGFSNYQDIEQGYGTADWNTNTPAPKDGFKESNECIIILRCISYTSDKIRSI